MKKVKSILALLLALMMLLALSVTVFADGTDGTITINNATIGKDYAVFKIFDATYRIVGTKKNVSYTYTRTGEEDALYAALTGNDSPFILTGTQVENVYVVSLNQGVSDEAVAAFLTSVNDILPQIGQTVTAESAKVVFSNLPYGYYYISSSLGATATIDSALKSVTVIDKNQGGPEWDNDAYGKTIESDNLVDKVTNTANYGDNVAFKIGIDTTNYDGTEKIQEYFIRDTVGSGLSYQKDSLKVFVNDVQLTGNQYSISYTGDNRSFLIAIKWYEYGKFRFTSPGNITVTYSATVTDKAVIAGEGNLNTAVFDYRTDNDPCTPEDPDHPFHEVEEKVTKTYVYALAIRKVDENGKSLADAHFNIGNLTAVKNSDGSYSYTGVAAAPEEATDFVSGKNGMIILKGLKADTYTVKETKAPAGYNLLADPIYITTDKVSETTATETTVYSYDSKENLIEQTAKCDPQTVSYTVPAHTVTVENSTGTVLPSTGGMGTTVFYSLGGLLVAAAGVLLITKKRMGFQA